MLVDSWSSTCHEVGDQQPGPPGADRADVEGGAGREEWAGRAQTLPEAREGPSDLTVSDPRKLVGRSEAEGSRSSASQTPARSRPQGAVGRPPLSAARGSPTVAVRSEPHTQRRGSSHAC